MVLEALIAVAGLAAMAAGPGRLPGAAAPGHASIAADCLACHTALAGTAVEKCRACHSGDSIGVMRSAASDSASRRGAVAGLHRAIAGSACPRCHAPHAGSDTARARPAFSHRLVSAARRARCDDCHRGERPADDLHRGAGNCGACHSLRAWRPSTFAHDTLFVLDRAHAVACTRCHASPAGHRAYDCFGCHEHTAARVADQHHDRRARDPGQCVRCHDGRREGHERMERRRHGDREERDRREGHEERERRHRR